MACMTNKKDHVIVAHPVAFNQFSLQSLLHRQIPKSIALQWRENRNVLAQVSRARVFTHMFEIKSKVMASQIER